MTMMDPRDMVDRAEQEAEDRWMEEEAAEEERVREYEAERDELDFEEEQRRRDEAAERKWGLG